MLHEHGFAFLAPRPFLVGGAVEGLVPVVPFPEVWAPAIRAISESDVGIGIVVGVPSRKVIFLGEALHPFLYLQVDLFAYDWRKGVLDYHLI